MELRRRVEQVEQAVHDWVLGVEQPWNSPGTAMEFLEAVDDSATITLLRLNH